MSLLSNSVFWNTLTHDVKTGVYSFQVNEHWLTLSADLLRKALNVTPADSAHPFESPPAGKTDITFTRRRVPSNWLMKMKFNRLLNLIWMIMSTIYNKTTRKLPVVEIKGKGSATDVQAAKSLLELHKPKKQHAESGGNSEKINSETDTEILNVGDEQGLTPSPVPATTYIPLTDKDLEILFQPMFDEYFDQSSDSEPVPTLLCNALIVFLQYICFLQRLLKMSTIYKSFTVILTKGIFQSFPQGEPSSAQSTSGDVSLAEPNQVSQPPDHLRKWTKDHPLDNIIVWELVPRPIYVMVIALKWNLQSEALMNMVMYLKKQSSVMFCNGYRRRKVLILKNRLPTSCTDRGHSVYSCQCCNQEYDHLPDGCQNCFLNGDLQEEVFISQHEGFEDQDNPTHVYRPEKLFMAKVRHQGRCNRVLERQKKLRNQNFRALTASADVPSSITETTDTTSTLPPSPPPLQKPTGYFKDGDGDWRFPVQYTTIGDLMTPQELRSGSFAKRVFAPQEADVIFVPFFGTISAELQLGVAKGVFRKKVGNEDYARQREVLDFVKGTDAWKRSGGRDHVFVLT
ncbi:probable arabinosyltransferase ARAD1, partial [Tanacetum coccineum]